MEQDELASAIEILNQQLQVIEDTLEEIRVELQWGVRNRRIHVTSEPLTPEHADDESDAATAVESSGGDSFGGDSGPVDKGQQHLF